MHLVEWTSTGQNPPCTSFKEGLFLQSGNVHNLSGLPLACLVFCNAHRAVHSNWCLMHFWHLVAQRCFFFFTSLHMHTQGSMLAIIFPVYFWPMKRLSATLKPQDVPSCSAEGTLNEIALICRLIGSTLFCCCVVMFAQHVFFFLLIFRGFHGQVHQRLKKYGASTWCQAL